MTELPGEIYLPYVDVVYNYLGTDQSYRYPVYGFLYGDIPDLYIVGWRTLSGDSDSQLVAKIVESRTFGVDNVLFTSLTNDVNALTASYENTLREIADKSATSNLVLSARGRNLPNQTGTDGNLANWTIKSTEYG